MMRLIHGTAKIRDAARHPGGSLVVHDKHSFNAVIAVRSKPCFQFRGRSSLAPVPWNVVDLDAELFRNQAPELREMSCLEQQYAIARRQCVDNSRFPGPRPRCRINY